MNEFDYLTLDDVVRLIRVLGVGPIHDIGLLDSAIARPRSSAFGSDAYPTIELKAAALLQSLLKNHSLVDGNKRLAWLSTTVFLSINGRVCALNDEEAFTLVWEIAANNIELKAIVVRMKIEIEGVA